ncbi:hypothetical protein B0H17DRAFT_1149778 [Mycena rosella]|uniref:Uncharacterized protein n=1 Tax=Mycena rosella TaxID=1033263 RepID=A0AAD7BYE1_MYCRO|nr:hypothetical protein B0H17DRAFT_1149778 [Mycena rosella]
MRLTHVKTTCVGFCPQCKLKAQAAKSKLPTLISGAGLDDINIANMLAGTGRKRSFPSDGFLGGTQNKKCSGSSVSSPGPSRTGSTAPAMLTPLRFSQSPAPLCLAGLSHATTPKGNVLQLEVVPTVKTVPENSGSSSAASSLGSAEKGKKYSVEKSDKTSDLDAKGEAEGEAEDLFGNDKAIFGKLKRSQDTLRVPAVCNAGAPGSSQYQPQNAQSETQNSAASSIMDHSTTGSVLNRRDNYLNLGIDNWPTKHLPLPETETFHSVATHMTAPVTAIPPGGSKLYSHTHSHGPANMCFDATSVYFPPPHAHLDPAVFHADSLREV